MNILAIGHESSRTGAPILMLDYLRWLVNGDHASVQCLLANTGPLLHQFEATCLTRVETNQPTWNFSDRIARKIGCEDWLTKTRLNHWFKAKADLDLIYVNTVASVPLLQKVRKVLGNELPVVIHVHELDSVLQGYEQKLQLEKELRLARKIIAASNAVKNCLQQRYQLPDSLIEVIYDWRVDETSVTLDREHARKMVREKISAPANATICLGAGLLSWRKGAELFPLIAKLVSSRCPDLHFVWIGNGSADRTIDQMKLDSRRLSVLNRVHFLGEKDDANAYMLGSDLFALPSREDPYPLVMLEAASNGLPTVAFANSGGAAEFIEHDAGILVPYLDIAAFAEAIVTLYNDTEQAARFGQNAASKIQQHHRSDATCQQLFTVMQKLIGPDRSRRCRL